MGEKAIFVDGSGLIDFGATPDGIEAASLRLAAGPLPAYHDVKHPLGVFCVMVRDVGERWTCRLKMLAQMASISPSVTRTKESNTYASSKVANLGCAMKVNVGGIRKVHHRPTRIFCERFE